MSASNDAVRRLVDAGYAITSQIASMSVHPFTMHYSEIVKLSQELRDALVALEAEQQVAPHFHTDDCYRYREGMPVCICGQPIVEQRVAPHKPFDIPRPPADKETMRFPPMQPAADAEAVRPAIEDMRPDAFTSEEFYGLRAHALKLEKRIAELEAERGELQNERDTWKAAYSRDLALASESYTIYIARLASQLSELEAELATLRAGGTFADGYAKAIEDAAHEVGNYCSCTDDQATPEEIENHQCPIERAIRALQPRAATAAPAGGSDSSN